MALLNYRINPLKGVAGMLWGDGELITRPAQIESIAQADQAVVLAGALTDDLVITITDVESGAVSVSTIPGNATEATLAASINSVFPLSSGGATHTASAVIDGADIDIDFVARVGDRAFTIALAGGPNAATPVVTPVTVSSAPAIEYGRMVEKGAADQTFLGVDGSTTVASLAGLIYITVGGVTRDLAEDPSALDTVRTGHHIPLMLRGRALVTVQTAVTPATVPLLRIGGTGDIGGMTGTADGGNTIDVSSICEFESTAAAGALAILRMKQ